MNNIKKLFIVLLLICNWLNAYSQNWLDPYNVIWESPSKGHHGQMPLGNGDIAAGVYAIENDALYMLLSKNDAYTYSGDLFKTGRVRIQLSPNPFAKGKAFKQSMKLENGSIEIEADGTSLLIWADANRSVYHVQLNSKQEIQIEASFLPFERLDHASYNLSAKPLENPTQDVVLSQNGHIISYFAVGDRSVYPGDLKYYDVEYMASEFPDPFRFNTFGNLMECRNLNLSKDVLSGSGKQFDIRIHTLCAQEPNIESWISQLEKQAAKPVNSSRDWKAHCKYWNEFWERSWITINDNTIDPKDRNHLDYEGYKPRREAKDKGALVAQSYNMFRYLMACQSRGRVQTKFNGGILNQPLLYLPKGGEKGRYGALKLQGKWIVPEKRFISHEDERLWGRRFTFQNQRLLYWPLLMSGDAELMHPFFDYYNNLLPMRKAITKEWFGHEGAYFRENIEPTGAEWDCGGDGKPKKTPPGKNDGNGYYHSYYFTCGLETVTMMIDYANYFGDTKFRDEVLVPFAREILQFYDKHYQRDENGKLKLDPAMVLETWWIAVNPATDVAGLQHNLDELLKMDAGTDEDKATWKRFRAEIPEIHLHKIDGRLNIAPALTWEKKKNRENGELYPIFPFRRFGIGLGNNDIAKQTVENRTYKNHFQGKCWTQDQIHYACIGEAIKARDGLINRYLHAAPMCRFNLYGNEDPDAVPDFDHFGSGSIALQRMLVQEANGKILLLPAWPRNWDATFKLHLSGKAVIEGEVKDGKLKSWSISPKKKKKDVVVYQAQ